MSSDNPPYPFYPNIPFNPSFFATNTGGLTQATANNLYLRKTVADTATAQETFSLGIKSQKVDGLLSSSIMYVGNNITSGSLILGNTGIRTKNQGIFEATSIRTPATNGQLTICTDLITGGSVEIGSVDGTVNLLGSAAGGVNVPTSAGVSTNAVNVAYLTTALSNVPRLNQVQTFTEFNTFNKPITVGYVPSLITNSSMIGYTVKDTITATTCSTAALQDLFSAITLPAGVWLITYSVRWIPSATLTTGDIFIFSKIDGNITPAPPLQISGTSAVQTITTSGLCLTGTFVVSSSGSNNYTITFVINFSGGTVAVQSDTSTYGSSVRRTRLA